MQHLVNVFPIVPPLTHDQLVVPLVIASPTDQAKINLIFALITEASDFPAVEPIIAKLV